MLKAWKAGAPVFQKTLADCSAKQCNWPRKRAYCPNLYTVKVWMAFLGGQRIFYVKPRLVVDKTP